LHYYPQDRQLMLVTEKDGRIIGGALGYGHILRIIALEPEHRGKRLGRRLIQTCEVGAMRRALRTISLGTDERAKGFHVRMGYRGRSSMHKELSLPGRALDLRLRRLEAMIGDHGVKQVVQADEAGRAPSLF